MLTRNKTLALLLVTFTVAAVGAGCGSTPAKKPDAGGAGTGAAGTGAAGTGAAGTGAAGTGAAGTGAAGTGAAGTAAAGTTGQAGMDAGAAGGDGSTGSDVADAPVEMVKPDGAQGVMYLFDTTVQGWHFTPYGSTPDGMPTAANNLAKTSVLVWDATNDADNAATSGSIKGTVPFTAAGDRIDFQAFTFATGMYDWTGYTISAKVKVVSGGNLGNCPLQAWLYISALPGYNTKFPAAVTLSKGNWVTLTFDMGDATNLGVDVSQIQQMGIQITTGTDLVCAAPDAGATDGATDATGDAADASVSDGATDSASSDAADGGVSDAGTDSASSDAADGGVSDAAATDASDAAVVVPTASTAVILIDKVTVTVK
jgi:hypothetical protein